MIILNTTRLTEIFVIVDDFMKEFEPYSQTKLLGYRPWLGKMSKSEMMTIVIFFHLSGIRYFSWYYKYALLGPLKSYFPESYPYHHFISKMPEIQLELYAFLHTMCMGKITEANYIDSKPLEVCHLKREKSHKVFKHIAQKGVTSKGYFHGLKLHMICNQQGEPVRFQLTSGNVSDNNEQLLKKMLEDFEGKVYGDKGYLTKHKAFFEERGCKIISKVRKNMKKPLLTGEERYYLKKRGLIETVFDQMVNICQIEHTRHRSPKNFLVNLWAGLIAYTFLDRLPRIQEFQAKKVGPNMMVLLED